METPTEKLAAKIMDRLIEQGLIRETERSKLLPKLAQGKMRGEDWRLEIELSQDREEDHE